VNAWEEHLKSFATVHPDNPITETGVRSEFTHGGLRSRVGSTRTDWRHQVLDPIIVVGPWIGAADIVYRSIRGLARFRGR
jgi:hypothetical protein